MTKQLKKEYKVKGKENTIRKPKKTSDDDKVCTYVQSSIYAILHLYLQQVKKRKALGSSDSEVHVIRMYATPLQAFANIIRS